MIKRGQLIMVLSAWLLATGAQWDLVQVIGWGQMVAKYAQSMPLSQALKKTFSGEMCGICEAVDDAKQDGQELPANVGQKAAKVFLALQPASGFSVLVSDPERWSLSDRALPPFDRSVPPLPPPRV